MVDNDALAESLEQRLQGRYVHVEAMLQAELTNTRSTILYSGVYRGIQRLNATDYIILENASYFGASGVNWGGDVSINSERIYVAHDRVISISETRTNAKK